MFPDPVTVIEAESLPEASRHLDDPDRDTHLLAGGQSLIPLMKQRLSSPDVLVDLSHIEPDEPSFEDGRAVVDALTTHAAIGNHAALTSTFDVVADVVPQIGDPQVRNMGTIGGSLAEADPGNDWGPAIIAMGGTIRTVSTDGRREIPAGEFFHGPFTPDLSEDEIVESVSIPVPADRSGGAYVKAKRRAGGYGLASAAVQLEVDGAGNCVAFDHCCSDDVSAYARSSRLEDVFVGREIDDDVIEEGAEVVADTVDPISDTQGSVEYKVNLCRTLFERAVSIAHQRARGGTYTGDPVTDRPDLSVSG